MVATFLGLCVLIIAVTVPTAGALNRVVRLWWSRYQDGKRWRPADHQLNTDGDAKVFIGQLHQVVAAEVAPRDVPIEPTPIFDAWREEYRLGKTLEKRRLQRALRQPTREMRAVFDEIVEDWLCSHCDEGDHGSCPGCSCPAESCRLVGAEVAPQGVVERVPVPLPPRLAVAAEPLPAHVESYHVGGRMTMTRTEGLRHG
jgi:hypothetical protein